MLQQNADSWMVDEADEQEFENHYFVVIIAKIGAGKNHQRMLNSWRNFDEDQDRCMVVSVFDKLFY